MVSICTNEVMSAIYAKLYHLNNGHPKYGSHFATAPTYAMTIKLPLPFAEAVQQLGSFETCALEKNYLYVPIYLENVEIEGRTTEDWCANQYDVPIYLENVEIEGRTTEDWCANQYEGLIPKLCALGIPMKNVDLHAKAGSAWWSYRVEIE